MQKFHNLWHHPAEYASYNFMFSEETRIVQQLNIIQKKKQKYQENISYIFKLQLDTILIIPFFVLQYLPLINDAYAEILII